MSARDDYPAETNSVAVVMARSKYARMCDEIDRLRNTVAEMADFLHRRTFDGNSTEWEVFNDWREIFHDWSATATTPGGTT